MTESFFNIIPSSKYVSYLKIRFLKRNEEPDRICLAPFMKFCSLVDGSEWLVFESYTFECCWSLEFFRLLFSVWDFFIIGSPERIISLLQSISCGCNILFYLETISSKMPIFDRKKSYEVCSELLSRPETSECACVFALTLKKIFLTTFFR